MHGLDISHNDNVVQSVRMILLVIFILILCVLYLIHCGNDVHESFNVKSNRPLMVSTRTPSTECPPIHDHPTCTHTTFQNTCHTSTIDNFPTVTVSGNFNICKDNYCEGKDIGTDAFLSFFDLLANQSGEGIRQMAVENILGSPSTHIKDKWQELKTKSEYFNAEKKKTEKKINKVHRDIKMKTSRLYKVYCENSPFQSSSNVNANDIRYVVCKTLKEAQS